MRWRCSWRVVGIEVFPLEVEGRWLGGADRGIGLSRALSNSQAVINYAYLYRQRCTYCNWIYIIAFFHEICFIHAEIRTWILENASTVQILINVKLTPHRYLDIDIYQYVLKILGRYIGSLWLGPNKYIHIYVSVNGDVALKIICNPNQLIPTGRDFLYTLSRGKARWQLAPPALSTFLTWRHSGNRSYLDSAVEPIIKYKNIPRRWTI